MKRALTLLLIFFYLFGNSQTRRVLFIGNSYTFYNDMPQIVANLASSGGATLIWQSSALPGYTLQQHSSNSTTLGLIQQGGWDYVILQEFSQYPSEPLSTVEVYVYPYARNLHSQVNSYNTNARTMFYMTWGRRDGDADRCARLPEVCTYIGMDDLTRERYMYMAIDNQAEVSPVGAVWRNIRQNFPAIELYNIDGSHPSEAGSYAAACAFYAAIFRKDPSLLTYNYTLSATDAANIRNAAKAVVYNNLATWYVGAYDVPDTQAPTAPTGLNATSVQQSSLTLNWTASTDNVGISGYTVYMNGVQVSTGRLTTASITGLSAATAYTFTVRARDGAGNLSPLSASLIVTTADTEAPTVPLALSSGNLTETGFTLSWAAATDNVGVTGYDVYRNGSLLSSVTGTSAVISGLTASTTYAMTVRARDAAGNASAQSTIFNVTTPDTHAPAVPAGLASANITQTSFTLSWTASTDNVGVIGYDVYRDGTYLETVTGTTFGISGLSAGTTYVMTVRAKDAANNVSAASTALSVKTLDPVVVDSQPPTAPTALASSGITQTSFILSWTASTDNVGVTGYLVYKNGVLEITVTSTSASITGLNVSTLYSFTVRARDAAGNLSAVSSPLSLTTPDTEAPAAPTGLSSGSLTETGFLFSWIASADNVGVTGYDVFQNGTRVASVTGTSANITGLSASTTYAMTVKAKDAAGNISIASAVFNVTTPDTQAPAAPGPLSASNITQSGFTLSWTASLDNVGVTGYDVYRNGSYESSVTGTTASITGLAASTSYAMTVRAKDAAGNTSVSSAILNVTTAEAVIVDSQAPAVPTGLTFSNVTQTGFTLGWTASTDNVGVTGYDVYQDGVLIATVAVNSADISGLTASATYAMTVSARDAAGNISGLSVPLNVTTLEVVIPDTEKPTAPTGLSSSDISETGFTLTWTASTDNIAVTGYDILLNSTHVTTVVSTTATLSDLPSATNYSVTVIAKDAAGNLSDPSTELIVRTLDEIIPDTQAPTVPAGLSSASVTETGFTLTWAASADDVGVTGYDVYRNGILLNTVTGTSMNITGLNAGATYSMTVSAKDAANNVSARSNILYVTTADFQAPTVPTGLSSAAVTETSFTFNWTASTDNAGVTGYDVYRNGTLLNTITGISFNVTGLSAGSAYSMTVRARDAAGNTSGLSSILYVTTADLHAPNVPAGLAAANITETSFSLTWTPSTDNVGVTGYDVYRNGSLLNSVTSASMTITGLNAGTAYAITIRAKDAAGNTSPVSSILNVTTLDTHAPSAPTGLTSSNLTQSSFTLNWTAASDNVGVTGYNVYRNGTLLQTVTAPSANVSGLSASVSYSMSVSAIDAAGNISSSSSVLVVTTPDTQAPAVPTGLTSSNISQSSFTLTWTASADNVGTTGYDVYQNGVFLVTVTGNTVGISGLAAYTSYAMTVRAKDAANNISSASAVLNVRTLDNQPPTTPAGLSISNLIQSGFRLNWTASTDNVGVAGYDVYQNGVQVATVTTNYVNITGLRASASYIMTVRARDAVGNTSPLSSPLPVTTPDTEAPSVPAGLSFSDLSQTGFTLTWSSSTDNVNVTGYDIYRDGVLVATVGGTAAGVTGLSAFRSYNMTVRARDAAGNVSAASAVLRVTTPDTEHPTTPTGLTYSNLTQSGFTLNWTGSTDNVGVTEYEIYEHNILARTVTGTAATLTGLAAARTYSITIRARDGAGNLSTPSDVLEVTTPDTEAPTVPSGLNYTNLTQSGFTLRWAVSTDNVGVTEYLVYQNGVQVTRVTGNSTVLVGLAAFRTYAMTVRAKDAAGNTSAVSSVLNVTTPDTEPPTVPAALTTNDITETGFTLKWKASSDNVGINGYEIYRDGSLLTICTDTVAQIDGLVAYKQYVMTVRAKDVAGNYSPVSDAIKVQTLDLQSPAAPAEVIADNVTDSTFTLSWSPASDNVGVVEYEVYCNNMPDLITSDTSIMITGLASSTQYVVFVKARDAAGNSSTASTEIQLITPDTQRPGIPEGLTAVNITYKSFKLKWNSAADNVGVTEYFVFQNDSLVATVTGTEAFFNELPYNTAYYMSVSAGDAAGNISDTCEYLEVTTGFPGNNATITVFPNPVRDDYFYIDLGREDFRKAVIELFDQSGNLLQRRIADGTNRLIVISDYELRVGVYYITVHIDGSVYNRKLIIDND